MASVSITSTPPGTVDARCMMCHTPPPPGREPNLAPLHHMVIIGAESLGEFFPRQAGKLPEPLAEIFREELRLRVLYLLTCFHSPTSPFCFFFGLRPGA